MPPLTFFGSRSSGGEGATLFSTFVSFFGVSLRDAERRLRKIAIFFEMGWNSRLFWISTPVSSRHLWVLSILLNTSVSSLTLSFTCPGLFLSITCWITLRALANFSIFTFCSFRSWRTSFHPSASGEVCECASSAFASSSPFLYMEFILIATCLKTVRPSWEPYHSRATIPACIDP